MILTTDNLASVGAFTGPSNVHVTLSTCNSARLDSQIKAMRSLQGYWLDNEVMVIVISLSFMPTATIIH